MDESGSLVFELQVKSVDDVPEDDGETDLKGSHHQPLHVQVDAIVGQLDQSECYDRQFDRKPRQQESVTVLDGAEDQQRRTEAEDGEPRVKHQQTMNQVQIGF
jgi:hypothetical protein